MNRSLDALAELKAAELNSRPFGSGGEQAIRQPHEPPPAPQPLQFPPADWEQELAERRAQDGVARTRAAQEVLQTLAPEDVERLPARPAAKIDPLPGLLARDRARRAP